MKKITIESDNDMFIARISSYARNDLGASVESSWPPGGHMHLFLRTKDSEPAFKINGFKPAADPVSGGVSCGVIPEDNGFLDADSKAALNMKEYPIGDLLAAANKSFTQTATTATTTKKKKKAFTLVELLVCVAIVGILVALLIPAIHAARKPPQTPEQAREQIRQQYTEQLDKLQTIDYEGHKFIFYREEYDGHRERAIAVQFIHHPDCHCNPAAELGKLYHKLEGALKSEIEHDPKY